MAAVEKKFSVAMAGSVVAHLVLLSGFLWYIGTRLEPAQSSWVLDLTLSVENSDNATLTEAPADQSTPRHIRLGAARAAVTASVPEDRAGYTGATAQAPPDPAERPRIRPATAADARQHAPSPAAAARDELHTETAPARETPVNAPVLATTQRARDRLTVEDAPARPVAVRRPVLPAQSKMLARKIRKWAEKLHKSEALVSQTTWRHKGQEYFAEFRREPARTDTDLEQVTVEVRTRQDGLQLSSTMHMKRLAFSNFAQFVNRWDPRVEVHDDELDGRFHSNSGIILAYDRNVMPTFHGKVSTASTQVKFADSRSYSRREQIFRGGLETGVRRISLPRKFRPFHKRARPATGQVHSFDEDTQITFYADGTYGWRASGPDAVEERRRLPQEAVYLIGAPRKTLRVRGTVTGSVLVYSPERIIIESDLVYPDEPASGSGSDAFLGLVSDKYVEIAPPEVTGPGDLRVHAAIYAGRRFTVRDFHKNSDAVLHLYGSLSAGTITATEPRFATRIRYDARLENQRPPGFPVTDRYEVAHWDGDWTAEFAATTISQRREIE